MNDNILTFYVPDLHCGGCVKRFTAAMNTQSAEQDQYDFQCDPLKRQVVFSLSSRQSIQEIKNQMQSAGFPAYVMIDSKKMYAAERRDYLKRLFVSAIGMMQVMMFAVAIYLAEDMPDVWMEVFHWFSLFVTTPVILYAGKPFFVSAVKAIFRLSVNMEVPIALALAVAYVYSVIGLIIGIRTLYFDSINMFLFLITLGRYAEWLARYKTIEASEALWSDIPQTVNQVTPEGDQILALDQVRPGFKLRVKVGAQFPVDGKVSEGQTYVDESMLTGESEPVFRQCGDSVYAGTVNQTQSVIIETVAVQGATQLGHIQRLLFEAKESKPRVAKIADRVAGYFITAILALAGIVGFYWWLHDPSQVIPIIVSLLIVTCPCALSLATPAAIAAALAQLTRKGIVVAKGDALEKAGAVSHFIFDKTGTLTENNFEIDQTHVLDAESSNAAALQIAAALEFTSDHPIARAFQPYSVQSLLEQVEHIETVPGLGIKGQLKGEDYIIGAVDAVLETAELKIDIKSVEKLKGGATQLLLLKLPATPVALFQLKSRVRPEARQVLKALTDYEVTLLSGDHENAVSQVADELELKNWQSKATPASKQACIKSLQAQGHVVLMVGDGVNDGPVLAQADIGIAMGQGTALAKSSADVVLMHDNLKSLLAFLSMSEATRRIIHQNMGWAIAYNSIAIPFAAAGLVPPWLAAIGMSFSSLLVVLNSLRLLRFTQN